MSAATGVAAPSVDVPVRSGAEVVALTERFYVQAFGAAVLFVGLAAAVALALLPLRDSSSTVGAATPTVVLAALLALAAPLVARRAPAVYRLVRRRRALEAIPVLLAAALLAYPLRSELWYPSCALLMLVAVVAPPRRTLIYAVLVLSANLAAHALAQDLDETPAVAIIGLWIGFGLWLTVTTIVIESVAGYLLSPWFDVDDPAPPRPDVPLGESEPRDADIVGPLALEPGGTPARGAAPLALAPGGARFSRPAPLPRLTARQRAVVALLADGLRYDDVAACLAISTRQVQRHVAGAVSRLGVRNANELVAVALAAGLVPRRRTQA